MKHSASALPLYLLVVLPLGGGCAGGGAVPVSGRVTLDGQPLAGAHVSFQPLASGGSAGASAGSGSYGITGADGTYTLRLADGDRPGAVVGQHRVEINIRNDSDDDTDRHSRPPPQSKRLPARYNLQSDLTFEVPPGGKSDANFDLKSK